MTLLRLLCLMLSSKGELVEIHDGGDICFLPNTKHCERGASTGFTIQMLRGVERVPPPEDSEESTWEQGNPARELLGYEADEMIIYGMQLPLYSFLGSKSSSSHCTHSLPLRTSEEHDPLPRYPS